MRIGYQAVFDRDFFDAISYAAENRFDYVQFDLNVPRYYLDELGSHELDRIRLAASDRAVGLSFHAPGDNVSLFSDFPAVRDGLRRQMEVILQRANDLGARHLTVHPGPLPSFRKAGQGDDDYRTGYWDYYRGVLADNLLWLAERAGNVLVCMENVGEVDLAFEAMGPLLGEATPLYLCWDFAKSQRQPGAEAFFRGNERHVREVHVHDVDRAGHSHAMVGSGSIDFGLHAGLMERDDVATTIEVRPREAALESKRRLLDVLAATRKPGAA